jgi:hypothetical protein
VRSWQADDIAAIAEAFLVGGVLGVAHEGRGVRAPARAWRRS